ncbi:MAG: NYN domain-containing protein [bacterium]|nr:NYN domain-containing protein [bacterium]
MQKGLTIFAYIDGANLHKGIQDQRWEMDFKRFRVWLSDKYGVKRAYLFIGLIPKNKDLYTFLQEAGYTLVFKETTYDGEGKVKGNCDADLVLQMTRDFYEKHFDQSILVSSDGDYASLVKFLNEHKKIRAILSPSDKCSILLKRTNVPIAYLGDQKSILRRKT